MKRAALAVLGLVSCGSENISLTVTPDAGMVEPIRCSQLADCPAGLYCEKTSCGDAMGTCQLVPATCPDDDTPVCGCDRINYYNDCLRQAAGVEAATTGACSYDQGTTCGGMKNIPCPDGTLCGRFVGKPSACSVDAMGSCWVIPATCPKTKPEWDSCNFSGPKCVDTCTAIRTGGAYHFSFMCP